MNNIPIYDITINDLAEGIQCVSIVDNPAMETDLLYFEKQDKKFNFTIENEHCIMGVLIKANTPIYRYDNEIGEYYVNFTKEVIKELAEKYVSDNLLNAVSLHHNGKLIEGIQLRELFIKDTDKGISPKYFNDVTEGSLFATFHITDNDLWEEIKNLGGFSIELLSDIKLQEDFNDVDIFDYLFTDDNVKKKFESESKIKDIIKEEKQVNITWGAEVLENQQIYGTCKINNDNGIIVYNPNAETWTTYNLKEIEVKVTDNPLTDFNYNAQWKLLINDMNIIIDSVKATNQQGDNSLESIIENKPYVMISYFDETEDGATGYRTCCVSSWGYTTRGNEAIRVYEYNGDTKSGFDEGHWRMLLTRRIIDLKVVDYMKPIATPPPLYNGELQAGSGKWGTMSNVIMTAKW